MIINPYTLIMEHKKNRVVTYLSEKYKNKLQYICSDREEKEAKIVREIIKKFLDDREELKIRKAKIYSKINTKVA